MYAGLLNIIRYEINFISRFLLMKIFVAALSYAFYAFF